MIWIDLENRQPTDNDVPEWIPWTQDDWDAWQAESARLLRELSKLNEEGKIKERNELIESNREHYRQLEPWLRAMSFGKCWFTESGDAASHMEVEHFRPKKVAKNLDGSECDGYWWLAFDYTNFRLAGNVPNRKKGGWFPIHEDSLRSQFHARCEESEAHYLLDPIKQTDAAMLAFDERGDAIPVPGTSKSSWEFKRVKESIKRFKLNDHDALPQKRRVLWQRVSKVIKLYLAKKQRSGPGNPGAVAAMEEHARKIRELTRPTESFSEVARWCVRFHNDQGLIRLISQ